MNYEICSSVVGLLGEKDVPYEACIKPIWYSESFRRVAIKPFADASWIFSAVIFHGYILKYLILTWNDIPIPARAKDRTKIGKEGSRN
jgi:hypothetical protein